MMMMMIVSPQAIQEHRRTTNNPLYWTNRDVCDWLRRVQLEVSATLFSAQIMYSANQEIFLMN